VNWPQEEGGKKLLEEKTSTCAKAKRVLEVGSEVAKEMRQNKWDLGLDHKPSLYTVREFSLPFNKYLNASFV
jgi:hypothetical protein